jgi:hypothetical protein
MGGTSFFRALTRRSRLDTFLRISLQAGPGSRQEKTGWVAVSQRLIRVGKPSRRALGRAR